MAQGSRWLIVPLVVAGLGGLSAPAEAEVFKLFGELHGGGVGGYGLTGDAVDADEDYFSNVPPLAYGARVGARLLIVEGAIQHHQFRGSDSLSTWTQFAVGLGIQPELGDEKARKARTNGYADVGVNVAFGLGTGRQVEPPLSNDEITDKAFLIEGRVGFGKHLNKVLDVGVVVPFSWGYFIKSDFGDAANNLENHYRSLQVQGLLYLRVNLRLL